MDLDVISLLKDGTADLILWLVDIDFGSGCANGRGLFGRWLEDNVGVTLIYWRELFLREI
jgi:hypothetical protein